MTDKPTEVNEDTKQPTGTVAALPKENVQTDSTSLVSPETSPLVSRDFLILAVVFRVAVIIRVVYVLQMRDNPHFTNPILDGEVHDNWARAILAGERFFDGAYFKAPLYPWLLAFVYKIFGPGYLVPRLVQSVMGAASCCLLFLVGREAFGRIVGAVAGLAAATFWVMVYFDGELLLEPLSIFLNLLAMWLILRAARSDGIGGWLLSGLVLGLSAITRPNVLVFMPLVALWILFVHRKRFMTGLTRAAFFGAACLVPILPITIRNYVVGDDFVLIASQGGPNFYI
ncbi:MAG: ArnT family glycosyltransferase, partial [Phycisphaerae bacterium]